MKVLFISMNFIFFLLISADAHCQSNLSISSPIFFGRVIAPDNYLSPTSPIYKAQFSGRAIGLGATINYSFLPKKILKTNHLLVRTGIGFYDQRFIITRPFISDLYGYTLPSTKYYSYQCLKFLLGLTYQRKIIGKYALYLNLSYSYLQSFRQKYKPWGNNEATVNHRYYRFGQMLIFSVGITREIGNNLAVGLNILCPLLTKWRNDSVLKDDPSTFSTPSFSLGGSINVAYDFIKNGKHK